MGADALFARVLHLRRAAGQMPEVEPVPWQGSGDLAAMARSNCFLVLPEADHKHFEAGDIVRIAASLRSPMPNALATFALRRRTARPAWWM